MLTSYASWRSIDMFTMAVPSPCKCQVFCNSRNSLTCHNKIICTIVITSCGVNNIIKWTTKVMLTFYASQRSIGVFTMEMSGQAFFNSKNSFIDHKKHLHHIIICSGELLSLLCQCQPCPHICETFFNSKNSLTYHKNSFSP